MIEAMQPYFQTVGLPPPETPKRGGTAQRHAYPDHRRTQVYRGAVRRQQVGGDPCGAGCAGAWSAPHDYPCRRQIRPHDGAIPPAYQYAVCGSDQLRAYDGADGYVRAGRWVFVDPPLGAWTDTALPNVGKARQSVAHRLPRAGPRRGGCVVAGSGTARGACRRWARNCSRRWCKLALDNGAKWVYDVGAWN